MTRYGWFALFWVLVAGSAIVAVWLTAFGPAAAQAIHGTLLVATFWAVAFYTFETRNLRLQQQTDQEIRLHPWLSISEYSLGRSPNHDGLSDDLVVSTGISNHGLTPAQLNVVAVFVWRSEGDHAIRYEKTSAALVVPNEKVTWRMPVKVIGQGTGELHLAVSYTTLDGGRGIRTDEIEITGPSSFRLLRSRYSVTLPSGRNIPDDSVPAIAMGVDE